MQWEGLCEECQGIVLPKERTGENHVAVRFGDASKDILVFVDGVDRSNDTTEAVGGEAGWALCFWPRPKPLCERCGRRASVRIERGQVEITRVA